MLKNDRYTYRITWSEEDQEYAGLCVEFPSLSWPDTNPEPLSGKRFSGKFMVCIPPELHRKLAIEAQEEGISLNRLASDKLSRQDA